MSLDMKQILHGFELCGHLGRAENDSCLGSAGLHVALESRGLVGTSTAQHEYYNDRIVQRMFLLWVGQHAGKQGALTSFLRSCTETTSICSTSKELYLL